VQNSFTHTSKHELVHVKLSPWSRGRIDSSLVTRGMSILRRLSRIWAPVSLWDVHMFSLMGSQSVLNDVEEVYEAEPRTLPPGVPYLTDPKDVVDSRA
jgi:hypothetical protein